MEAYNGSEQGAPYMIQGMEVNPHPATIPSLEPIQVMDNDVSQEFIVDQGMYYPANYYGYYSTGFESTGEWDDQNRFFGLDGSDYQYAGLQTDTVPYVYYTPTYGYAAPQSPYNPYNPYIPGAIIGVDGSYVGMQQYYPGATYQHPGPSTYYPFVVQPSPDNVVNSALEPHALNTGAPNVNGSSAPGLKPNPSSASTGPGKVSSRPATEGVRSEPGESAFNQSHSLGKRSEVQKSIASATPNKQLAPRTSTTTGTVPQAASSQATQGKNASGSSQVADQLPLGQGSSLPNPVRVSLPVTSGLPEYGSNSHRWNVVDKPRSRFNGGGFLNYGNGNPDYFGEQNRGPRTNRSRSQWAPSVSVEAYTSGSTSAHGNIIIHADDYNKEDFSVDYADAKFFVIKSYSEDDVHKSIKYNVWSSTPNGNKRLNSAYEDSRRIAAGTPGGCPIFLFFSVNASGQFCGVAEMIGSVDFNKDVGYWQQDKWSGSFPVKWHIVKDVSNTNFRHIILENNENKPVTNSRDTQEIKYKPGMEMLKIFKKYMLKTSILDDFVYYEEREKILQQEKARLHGKSYSGSSFVPAFIPMKPNGVVDQNHSADGRSASLSNGSAGTMIMADLQVPPKLDASDSSLSSKQVPSKLDLTASSEEFNMQVSSELDGPNSSITGDLNMQGPPKLDVSSPSIGTKAHTKHSETEDFNDMTPALKIGSLTMDSKQAEETPAGPVVTVEGTEAVDVVTVGSLPVKVNGHSEASPGILTIGTVAIAPKGLAPGLPNPGNVSGSGK